MAVQFWQAIPSILSMIVCFVILFLLVMNYLLNKFLPSLLFILFFTGIELWSVTKLVSVFLPETSNANFVLIWKISSLSILILSLLVICFFRDLLIYSTLSYPSVIASFFAGITLAALWWGDFATVNYSPTSGWNTDYTTGFTMGILLFYLAVVYILMFIMLISGLRKATNKAQRQQISLLITGIATAAIGGIIVNYLLNLIEALKDKGDFDLLFIVIGFSIVAWAYLKSPMQIYLAPVSAYRLIVINNDGIPLLTHDFYQEGEKGFTIDPALISGAIAGVIGILKEALASESAPKIIHLGDRVLLLEKTASTLCTLIAESDSFALRAALKDFSREFEHAFKDVIKDWQGVVDQFAGAYDLIQEDFAFVLRGEIAKVENNSAVASQE